MERTHEAQYTHAHTQNAENFILTMQDDAKKLKI